MKKVIAINGSPRKRGNTATILEKALEGAGEAAETKLVHLYDLQYSGCRSCFACKRKDGKSYGKCAVHDDLQPLLQQIEEADALILGSPIYLGMATGQMRAFMERLLFPYLVYDTAGTSLFSKKMPVGLIYTMNVSEQTMNEWGYDQYFTAAETMVRRIFGQASSLFVNDTCQFSDYSKYVAPKFDADKKAQRRREVFPKDCERARLFGSQLVKEGGFDGVN